jgi:hypothetical protein
MTEIKKLTKIALIVDAIIWVIFGVLLVFLFDVTLNYEGWTNPIHVRAFGGLCFVACIFAVIMLRKKEWEEIKLLYIFLLSMCISVMIVEVAVLATFASTFMAATISQMILDLVILSGKVALGLVAYFKQ